MTAIDLNGATVVVTGAGATATPGQVARHVVDVIADGSYSAPAYHLAAGGLRALG